MKFSTIIRAFAVVTTLAMSAGVAVAQQEVSQCMTVADSPTPDADTPALLAGPACPAATPPPVEPHEHTPPLMAGSVRSLTLNGAEPLLAAFPVARGLRPSWGMGAIPKLYGGGEGAFRFTCGAEGQLRYDDPLVLWDQFGKAHLHLFWGPTSVDAATTMTTLGAMVGNSTCNYGEYTLN